MTQYGPAAVVIPTLNEIAHIEGLLWHLLAEPPEVVGEVLVADGGSRDGTQEAVHRIARSEPRVRLIDNPDRIQAAGVNRAVAMADRRFGVIVRVDAHALYPGQYVGRLLAALEASGADSVVVRLDTVGRNCLQRAVAAAQNSRVGIGGYIWDADGFICATIQQNPAMPAALKDTACTVIEKLLEPILTKLPWLPPEYKSLLPKAKTGAGAKGAKAGSDTDQGVRLPEVTEISYATGDGASVETLLGGGS